MTWTLSFGLRFRLLPPRINPGDSAPDCSEH
jgi:hypothetical protein